MVLEEAEEVRRLPFAAGGQHPALAVMEVGMPQSIASRDLVGQHLTRLGRRTLLVIGSLTKVLAHQPASAHDPGQGRIGGHRTQSGVGTRTAGPA